MKAIKYIGYFIITIVALVLIVFCALVLFFDPNNYKADIERIAKEKANIQLNINGNIRWTFYPWLGISIQDTSVASLTTPDKPFAKVHELDLSVRLLPLLKRQIQMNDINVEGLVIDLQKDEEGNTNWDKVGEVAKTDKPSTAEQQDTKTTSSNSQVNIDILSVTINDSKFRYNDIKLRQEYTLSNIHLSTGAIRGNAPFTLKLGANFASKNPDINTTMQLHGKFSYDLNNQRYQIEDLDLTSDISGAPLNGKTVKLIADGNVMADLKAGTAQWDKLSFAVDVFKITGQIKAKNILKEPNIEGNLVANEFNLQNLLTNLGIVLPAMSDKQALTALSFNTNLTASTKNVALNNLKIKLDETTLTGNVAITDFAKQALTVNLVGDKINVDNYLPAKANQTSQTTQTPTTTNGKPTNKPVWSNDVLFDLRNLQGKNFNINFVMNQLTVNKLPWQQLVLKTNAANGIINLQDIGGKLFGGTAKITGRIDVKSSATPKIELKPAINNIPLDKVLAALNQQISLKGDINLNGNLRTTGVSQLNLVKNLNGTANFVLNNGAFVGENLEYQVCQGVAKVRGKKLTTNFDRTETKFNQLKGSLNITNGIANNQDLILGIAGLEAKGKGTFNIITMMIDYNISLALKGDQSPNGDAACKVGKDVAGVEFPVLCQGSLLAGGNLCNVDTSKITDIALDVGKNKAKEELNKALDKKLEKLDKKGKLKDAPALRGLIQGVLK